MLTAAARKGDDKAQYLLGTMYYGGTGVEHSPETAAKLFEKASFNWNDQAIYHLGLLYLLGDGVPQDDRRGIGLIKLAAELGNDEAAALLATRGEPHH